MHRINQHQLGIEQDTLLLFSDFQDGGEMWDGAGPREIRRSVTFGEAFQHPPVVTVGLSMLDIDQGKNHRVDIQAQNITRSGFDIVFRTWGDTRIARVRADWLVMGALRHEDAWDV